MSDTVMTVDDLRLTAEAMLAAGHALTCEPALVLALLERVADYERRDRDAVAAEPLAHNVGKCRLCGGWHGRDDFL